MAEPAEQLPRGAQIAGDNSVRRFGHQPVGHGRVHEAAPLLKQDGSVRRSAFTVGSDGPGRDPGAFRHLQNIALARVQFKKYTGRPHAFSMGKAFSERRVGCLRHGRVLVAASFWAGVSLLA